MTEDEQWDESGGGFFMGLAVAVVFGAFFYALVIGGVMRWIQN